MLTESSGRALKIAFVVPTKDRPEELRKLLASVSDQTRRPDQLIVVDGSDPPVRDVVDAFPDLRVDYTRIFPPSLSRQRNAGMERVRPDITLAGYLDDDIVLEPDAVQRMLAFWKKADPKVGGAAFNITNAPMPNWIDVKRWFDIDDSRPGKVLPSGCVSTLGSRSEDFEVDWLCGGATVWRREIIDKYPYDEWFVGTGYMEDVDFSFNIGARFRLVLVTGARLAHYSPPVRLDRQYLLGRWQIVNRMYFVRKYRDRGMSMARAWWASFGMVLLNVGYAVVRRDRGYWDRARGNVSGVLAELVGRREQIGGHLK